MNKEKMRKIFEIMSQVDDLFGPLEVENIEAATKTVGCAENLQPGEVAETVDTGPNHDPHKRYSDEFKEKIVRLRTEKKYTLAQITQEYGVNRCTVSKWVREAQSVNEVKRNYEEKEIQKIINENKRIREENAFLKRIMVLLVGQEMGVKTL